MSTQTNFCSKISKIIAIGCIGFSTTLFAGTPVNINQASSVQLAQSLDGIGPSKADAIVSYREENGPFVTVDALVNVSGIGEATLLKNRDFILLGTEADSEAEVAME